MSGIVVFDGLWLYPCYPPLLYALKWVWKPGKVRLAGPKILFAIEGCNKFVATISILKNKKAATKLLQVPLCLSFFFIFFFIRIELQQFCCS